MEQKLQAIDYLAALAPGIARARVAAAVDPLPDASPAILVQGGARRLGIQLRTTQGSLADLFSVEGINAALEEGDSPRLYHRGKGGRVFFKEGERSVPIPDEELRSDQARTFLVASPRLNLDPLRAKKRIGRLWAYLLKERATVKAIVIYAVFVELLSLTIPLTIQVLINTISFGFVSQQLILLTLLLLIALSGAATLRVFQMVMLEHLSRRFMSHVFEDFSERLENIEKAKTLQPVYRFFEVVAVDKALFILGLDFLTLLLQLLAASLLLAFYHPTLLAFTLVMAASAALVLRLPFKRGVDTSLEESHAKYDLADYLDRQRWDEVTRIARIGTWLDARAAAFRVSIGQQIGLFAVQVVLSTALLFLGGELVIQGELTLGQLVAAELVAGTALLSLSKVGKQLPKIYDLVTSFEKLGKLVDLPHDGKEGEGEAA